MSNGEPSKYAATGVDVKKKGIEAFRGTIRDLYPGAFCVITPDLEHQHGRAYFWNRAHVLHTDGAGSKPVQTYLHYRETEDPRYFRDLAQDAIAMNLDDIYCVDAKPIAFADYVAINKRNVPKGTVLRALDYGFKESFEMLRRREIRISFAGGETADLPDQLRTLDVSGTIYGIVDLNNVITGRKIKPGNVIVGLRSGGRARWEKKENSGIMCNGITLARHCLMKPYYAKRYPEIRDPDGAEYYGRFRVDDDFDGKMTVSEAIMSPTRIFAPVLKRILEAHRDSVTGLVHDTGGGQTKCLRLGRNIRYVKNNVPIPDPIFTVILGESKESWKAMYEDFNMGIGFDVIVDEKVADDVISISERFGVEAMATGHCERSEKRGRNEVVISGKHGLIDGPLKYAKKVA